MTLPYKGTKAPAPEVAELCLSLKTGYTKAAGGGCLKDILIPKLPEAARLKDILITLQTILCRL